MEARTPTEHARYLATYIKDPSTIRVNTLHAFGRAPSLDECAKYRAHYEYQQSRNVTPTGKRAPVQLDKADTKTRNAAIRREHGKGLNAVQIAARLGLNRKTVYDYLRRGNAA